MRVKRIGFAGGSATNSSPLELIPTAITVFIGPNNGGKSTALREIHAALFGNSLQSPKVVLAAELAHMDAAELSNKLEALVHGPDSNNPGHISLGRRSNSNLIHESMLRQLRDQPTNEYSNQLIKQLVLPHYAMNLNGETRLSLSNPGAAQKLGDRAMSTVAAIFKNDVLRKNISNVIYDAFGLYLVVDATQLGSLTYALSSQEPSIELERSFTDDAIAFFDKAEPIARSSDGTKAFVGVVTEVLAGEADVLFIDEPEAFLHPGLAYALGREIALNVSAGKQLFAATHSPQFLMGCLSAGVAINVVRLSRSNGLSVANLLDSSTLSEMMSDPLLRSSNVVSGLFYNSAVVVEGDSDRSFYEEINLRLAHVGRGIKHTLFINAHGKQTAPEIVRALRSAGVPAAMILDLDWLKEDGAVQAKYFSGIGLPNGSKQSLSIARGQTRRDLESAHKDYKRAGGIDLLSSDEKASAENFLDSMAQYGLFTVRRGEVEAWLSNLSISKSKNGWLERIFSAMGSRRDDPSYIHADCDDVWEFIESVSNWISNAERKGFSHLVNSL